jgi:hypothetical protein
VANEGWGARLLALQGEDGQWARGACFPARSFNWRERNQGQPWTATLPTLQLLREFGVDPRSLAWSFAYLVSNSRTVALRNPSRLDAGVRSTSSNESCPDVRAPAKSSTQPGSNSRFQRAGTTTCSVPSNTSARSGMCRIRGWTKRSRTATVGPAGGTPCGRYVSSAGTSSPLPETSGHRPTIFCKCSG